MSLTADGQLAVTLNGTVPASAGGARVVTTSNIELVFGVSLTVPQADTSFVKLLGQSSDPSEDYFSLPSTVNSVVVRGRPGTWVEITLGTFESP